MIARIAALCAVLAVAAASDFELTVHFKLSPSANAEIERTFWAVATPQDAQYLQHRTPSQLAALIATPAADLAAAKAWLASLGATHVAASALRDTVTGAFASAAAADSSKWSARGLPLKASRPAAAHIVTRRDFFSSPMNAKAASGAGVGSDSGFAARKSAAARRAGYTVAHQKVLVALVCWCWCWC